MAQRRSGPSEGLRDFAFVAVGGELVAHRADCPVVRKEAEDGKPVMTLFGCTEPVGWDIKKHSCLDE